MVVSPRERVQREQVRLDAAEMFERDVPAGEVAARLRVSTKYVYQWRRRWRADGLAGLVSHGPVLIPATDSLGSLDRVISVLFGWGRDHVHVFRAGRRTFSDPGFSLDDAQDEDDRLSRLFATGVRKLTYTYDLGTGWEHEIVLDKLIPPPPGRPGPRCVAFAGDSPLEYPVLEDDDGNPIPDPVVTRPFDLDRANAILASGHYDVDTWDPDDLGDHTHDADEPQIHWP